MQPMRTLPIDCTEAIVTAASITLFMVRLDLVFAVAANGWQIMWQNFCHWRFLQILLVSLHKFNFIMHCICKAKRATFGILGKGHGPFGPQPKSAYDRTIGDSRTQQRTPLSARIDGPIAPIVRCGIKCDPYNVPQRTHDDVS